MVHHPDNLQETQTDGCTIWQEAQTDGCMAVVKGAIAVIQLWLLTAQPVLS